MHLLGGALYCGERCVPLVLLNLIKNLCYETHRRCPTRRHARCLPSNNVTNRCQDACRLSVALRAHHIKHNRSRGRALRLHLCAAFSLQSAHPAENHPPLPLLCSRVSPAATQQLRSRRAPAQGWPQPVRHWQAREHRNKCAAVSVCHDPIRLLWSITPSEQSLQLEPMPEWRAVYAVPNKCNSRCGCGLTISILAPLAALFARDAELLPASNACGATSPRSIHSWLAPAPAPAPARAPAPAPACPLACLLPTSATALFRLPPVPARVWLLPPPPLLLLLLLLLPPPVFLRALSLLLPPLRQASPALQLLPVDGSLELEHTAA